MKIRLLAMAGIVCGLSITLFGLMLTLQHMFDSHFTGSQAAKLAGVLVVGMLVSTFSYITYKFQKADASNSNDLELEVKTLADYQQIKDVEKQQVPIGAKSQTTISSNQKEEQINE